MESSTKDYKYLDVCLYILKRDTDVSQSKSRRRFIKNSLRNKNNQLFLDGTTGLLKIQNRYLFGHLIRSVLEILNTKAKSKLLIGTNQSLLEWTFTCEQLTRDSEPDGALGEKFYSFKKYAMFFFFKEKWGTNKLIKCILNTKIKF